MRFIFLAFIVGVICSSFSANAAPLPKTSITLKNPQGICTVQVSAWLSPSCAHCAGYFTDQIPKITGLPGFCMDLHFLPHLYLLDMPVSVLIWSKGQEEAYKIAEFFYKNQDDWFGLSAARANIDDPRRAEDLEGYLKEIQSDKSKNLAKIKAYLEPGDPYLYVKICALRYFSIEHLEKYLPKKTFNTSLSMVDKNLGEALMNNLPSKDGKVLNFSPVFTNATGELIPDGNNPSGLFITFDAAKKLLEKAGPFTPNTVTPKPSPSPAPVKKQTLKTVKKSQPKKIEIKPEDKDIQDADGDVHMQDTDDSEMQDADADENDDNDLEEEFPEDEDWEEDDDNQLDEIVDESIDNN